MNETTTRQQVAALVASVSTAQLIEMLTEVEKLDRSPERATTRLWIIDALETRYPAVNPIMDAWADELANPELTYAEQLIAAVKQVAA